MAYPRTVMDSPLSRELSPFNPEWSVPQLQDHLASALRGDGPALSTLALAQKFVSPRITLVVRTSGSTGNPKSVALTAAGLLSNVRATHAFLGAKPGERWSLLLPTSHIAGLNVLIRSLELGTPCVGITESADYTAIVPTQLFRALHGDEELLRHLRGCKKILVGGGALDHELRMKAEAENLSVVETYGMTESCGGVIYDGRALDGVEVSIIDDRIALRGVQIQPSYLDEEITLRDGWFMTNDRGEINNGVVKIYGRADDQIISGGEKISLSAIESFLRHQFPTNEIVAFAKKDREWGERLCLASTSPLEFDLVAGSLKSEFGKHASPKELITIASIPYLSIGKPDRRKLADDYS